MTRTTKERDSANCVVVRFQDPWFTTGLESERQRLRALAAAEKHFHLGKTAWLTASFDQPSGRVKNHGGRRQAPWSVRLVNAVESILLKEYDGPAPSLTRIVELLMDTIVREDIDPEWRRRFPDTPLLWHKGNFIVPCLPADAKSVSRSLGEFFNSRQVPIKGAIRGGDLAKGALVRWSDFVVSRAGQELDFSLQPIAWHRLGEWVRSAASDSSTPSVVGDEVARWLLAYAPALPFLEFEFVAENRIAGLIRDAGIEASIDLGALRTTWFKSVAAWQQVRDHAPD